MPASRWHFELWTPDGKQVADLAGRAAGRRITQIRNDAEDIVWTMNLDDFEQYAKDHLKGQPEEFIMPGITEVRVRRGSTYICGGQVTYANPKVPETGPAVYEIRAQGFLNLLLDRLTVGNSGDPLLVDDRTFTAIEPGLMLATVVTESQAVGPDWDFGITIGTVPTTGIPVDKTYKQQELKEAIQYGNDQYNIDHQFTHDKVFNQYAPLGSVRSDLIFEYPGNVLAVPQAPIDATNIQNWVLVRGSGSGKEAAAFTIRHNIPSQADYKVRQKSISFSDVEEIAALNRHGDVQLDAYARPFQVPQLIVDGNVFPFVTDYGIGDYVPFKSSRYKTLRGSTGLVRVEQRVISIDENDKEAVSLWVSK